MAVKKAKRKVVKAKATKKVAKKSVKKVVKKAPAAKKAVVAKKAPVVKKSGPKVNSVSKNYSKSQVLGYIADQAGISKKEAVSALTAIDDLISAHLKSNSVGSFTLPGLLKCTVVRKPATKARKGINPFTGEPTTFKAKPARNVVKIRALKRLKEIVK
jgi:nucleoid DNA-binding protein